MRYISIFVILFFINNSIFSQDLIQITGVTMTTDSMETIPFVSIKINNIDKGDKSNYNGLFSLVCKKGDTLSFWSKGYDSKEFIVPKNLKGTHYTMVQFMDQDTYYLPAVIFRQELPTGRDFEYAFRYWDLDDDMFVVARKNLATDKMEYQMYTLPKSGAEAQTVYMNQQNINASYKNQIPNQLKISAIPDFINAWRRGDLKRKK